MERFKNSALIVLAIASLFSFALIFHRVLDPDRVCLQWDGLSQVRFGSEVVGSCSETNRLRRPQVSEPLRDWIRRLNRLQRFSWVADSPLAVRVTIDDNHPFSFVIKGRDLKIGYVLAEKPDQLERAVLLAWIGRNWPDHEPLARGVMADILTWSVVGDASWTDPTREVDVSPIQRLRFSLIPHSKQGYCGFAFRSAEDLAFCQEPGGSIDPEMALRPLVAWTLWTYIRQRPASDQIRFYRALLTRHFQPSEAEDSANNLQEWTRRKSIELLQNWSLKEASSDRELQKVFASEELTKPVSYDLTVEVPEASLARRAFSSLKIWTRLLPNRRVLFVSGDRKLELPEGLPVDMEEKDFKTRRYVILACEWPKVNAVAGLKSRLFYAIRVCGGQPLPSWRELMTAESRTTAHL